MNVEEWLDTGLHIGKYHITIWDVITIAFIFLVITLVVRGISYFVRKAGDKQNIDKGKRYTLVKLIKYFLYTLGLVMSLEQIGINVNVLIAGSAALLVGVGLGLQNIFNDVVSGFVILFEGVIRVGDIVEFDGIIARVIRIDIRTSKVVTRKGIYLIVPNSKITSNNVVNWSQNDLYSRLSVNVGVAYGSETSLVKELLVQAAMEHELVEKDRPIEVVFQDFGDSALLFELRFWATRSWVQDAIKSDIRFRIDELFRERGVQIPFPQRDVHMIPPKS